MVVHVGIVGKGTIGSELYAKVVDKGWKVDWIGSTQGIFEDFEGKQKVGELNAYPSFVKGLDAVFLTIPTFDKGETAKYYLQTAVAARVPIITCEKGALSNFYSELEEAVRSYKIGYHATVGGGTDMLDFLQKRMGLQVREVHAIVNGTLNYVLDGLSRGRSLGEVIAESEKLKYAEPGAKHPLDIVNQEAIGDVPMKTAILFNIGNFTKEKMIARDIRVQKIESHQLNKLLREAVNRRYIVSITKECDEEEDVIWGFKHNLGEWHISAGFKHVNSNPLFRKLLTSGVDNSILTSEGDFGKDGSYVLSGPGAGPGPTAGAMLREAEQMII